MTETPSKPNPKDLVLRKDVELVLHKDKGNGVQLESFEVVDFTNAGDNYACVVSSVAVTFSQNGKKSNTSYVVKLNPMRAGIPMAMMTAMFERETGFYVDILPQLNDFLEKSGENKLRVAKHFHSLTEQGKEVIYMEDLRTSGYRMHSRYESMDKQHTLLIIKEIARLHSSSFMLLNQDEFRADKHNNFKKKYPYTKDLFDSSNDVDMSKMLSMSIQNCANLIDGIPGYEYAVEYLKENSDDLLDVIFNKEIPKEPFVVLSHGDCWNNNFLFKYSKGEAVDCRILDLQGYKVSTGGFDLNHLLFTSVTSSYRRENLQSILDIYYATFASVLSKPGIPMPITQAQLKREFHDKHTFGLVMACAVVPNVLLKPEDAPNLEDFLGENFEEGLKKHGELVASRMKNSPLLKPRLLESLEEMKSYGFFSNTNVSNIIERFNSKE